MTDALPPPETPADSPRSEPDIVPAERVHVADGVPAKKRRDPLPILFGLGVVVLLGAVFYLWQHPLGQHLMGEEGARPAAPTNQAATAADAVIQKQLAALQRDLEADRQQLEQAEQQSRAARQQAEAAQQQVQLAAQDVKGAHEQAQAATQDAQAARQQAQTVQQENEAMQQRLLALERRPAPAEPNFAPLEARLAALEKRAEEQPQPAPLPPELANLGPRVDALAGRFDQLATREEQLATREQQAAGEYERLTSDVRNQAGAIGKRLDALEARVGELEQQASKFAGLADRAGRVAQIQAAEAALDAGLPIGNLPGAPPALARFAASPPPTEASLRLAFPTAAEAAAAAARPETAHIGFWQGVKRRLESLVTVRRGDQIIVGNPVQGTIARAGKSLDAGDLAGAVNAISELQGPPAAAFAAWRTRAESLVEARRALAALAAHAALTSAELTHS